MNPFIFRKQDIRGVWGNDWEAKDARDIGAAFGTWLKDKDCRQVILGRDNRLSSEKIRDSLVEGITSTGLDVLDLGLTITPLIYFSRVFLKNNAAIQITGSHNPPEWNGLKVCFYGKTTLLENDLHEIRRITESKQFVKGAGKVFTKDIKRDYFATLEEKLLELPFPEKTQKVKVLLDFGNGVAALFVPEFLKKLGCEVTSLHSRLDGTFPNHTPDPSIGKNMMEISVKTVQEKADLGIAFDVDADRINIVDEKGYTLWGDGIIIFFARDILARTQKENIIFNTQCSPAVEEDVLSHGGFPHMVATGHAYVARELELFKGLFAGEYKGHIFFADHYFGFDDGLYSAARFIKILSSLGKPLSQFMSDVPAFKSTGEILIPFPDEKKFVVKKKVTEALSKSHAIQYFESDARIKFTNLPDTWGLVRCSNTMPNIQVFAWAKTAENLAAARDIMIKEIEKYL